MNYHINNEQGMTEIIFAQRNKAYGAYQIRSQYGETTLKSIGIMLLGAGALLGLAFNLTRPDKHEPDEKTPLAIRDSVFVIPFSMEEEKVEKTENKEQTKKTGANEMSTSTSTLISDSLVLHEIITSSLATNAVTSTSSLSGTEGSDTSTGTEGTVAIAGTSNTVSVKNGLEVDQMPRFKGGLKALNDFIRLHVHYPESAVEENRSGTVHIRFVVDETGKVVNAELLNTLGQDLNLEALRVIGLIPDFEAPGYSKGEPVKTYYQLPINFKLR